jgi:hypothetical protein
MLTGRIRKDMWRSWRVRRGWVGSAAQVRAHFASSRSDTVVSHTKRVPVNPSVDVENRKQLFFYWRMVSTTGVYSIWMNTPIFSPDRPTTASAAFAYSPQNFEAAFRCCRSTAS